MSQVNQLKENETKLKENELKLKNQLINKDKLLKQLCANARKNVTCQFCNKIFSDPIELPCLHSICKSHLTEFSQNECIFCKQIHSITDNSKSNESLCQTLEMNLHLTEQEKLLKAQIENLFNETNLLAEKLKKDETEAEMFCYEHFSNIMNSIDLQKERLKLKIDEIGENLINQVKDCKSKFATKLKINSSRPKLTDEEIEKLKCDTNEEFRKVDINEENLRNFNQNLYNNACHLKSKINEICRGVLRAASSRSRFKANILKMLKVKLPLVSPFIKSFSISSLIIFSFSVK